MKSYYYDNVEHKVEISESKKIPIIESRLKKRIVSVPEVTNSYKIVDSLPCS